MLAERRQVKPTVRQTLTASARHGACFVGALALLSYDAQIGLVVIATLVLTSPVARRFYRWRRSVDLSPPPEREQEQVPPAGDHVETLPLDPAPGLVANTLCTSPERLDDDALARAWRLSYALLEHADQPDQRASADTATPSSYLDEMQRRNSAWLAAWLDSGARAAGGPTRFVRRDEAS